MTGQTNSQLPARGRTKSRTSVPLDSARKSLAWLWGVGAGIMVLVVVLQSLLGGYGAKTGEAWQWLLPTILPSVGMILTYFGDHHLEPRYSPIRSFWVKRTFCAQVWCLSLFYLLLVSLSIFLQPFVAKDASEKIQLMHMSNYWLGPIQGILILSLGKLFVSKQEKASGASDDQKRSRSAAQGQGAPDAGPNGIQPDVSDHPAGHDASRPQFAG